ncbi:MAG: helix-turn-helix domain-containing protein [Prevotellaceae bacterium]|nr:helix-turn-helix domain-containing protein [Prevotellaceae bacterium]
MKPRILPFDWHAKLENRESCSIGDDFILLDNPDIPAVLNYPFKLDVFIAAICIKGTVNGSINMQSYTLRGPNLVVCFPDQIVMNAPFSDDFSGLFIIMSKQFTNDLKVNIKEALSLNFSFRQKPWIPLDEQALSIIKQYFYIMKQLIRITENPYRMEVVKHMTISFFYGMGYYFHPFTGREEKSRRTVLVEEFLDLVQLHYREQRELAFYAGKLCLTPRHLSKVIKETSGTTANDWIDRHVILEAKALLKSTGMTVQQISEELNFPSQSFFGKYFKRCTGISPSEYKK